MLEQRGREEIRSDEFLRRDPRRGEQIGERLVRLDPEKGIRVSECESERK